MSNDQYNSKSGHEHTRILKALEHVKSNWIPFNNAILNRLKHTPNAFEMSERQTTIFVLKQDLGLFTYCLKEIMLDPELRGAEEPVIPLELLASCPAKQLERIIKKAETEIFHQIGPTTSTEQDRLLSIPIISAVVSKSLAPAANLDPDSTYISAILRHLGIVLVAWNYPSLFEKAAKMVGPECNIEKAIYSTLGHSALSLSISVAKNLEFSESLAMDIGEESRDFKVRRLRKICRIGEALAHSQQFWMNPNVDKIAKEAAQEVEELLGVCGMEIIQKAIADNCGLMLDKIPQKLLPNKKSDELLGKAQRKTITVYR